MFFFETLNWKSSWCSLGLIQYILSTSFVLTGLRSRGPRILYATWSVLEVSCLILEWALSRPLQLIFINYSCICSQNLSNLKFIRAILSFFPPSLTKTCTQKPQETCSNTNNDNDFQPLTSSSMTLPVKLKKLIYHRTGKQRSQGSGALWKHWLIRTSFYLTWIHSRRIALLILYQTVWKMECRFVTCLPAVPIRSWPPGIYIIL